MNSEYKINKKKNLYNGFYQLEKINFTHRRHDKTWSPNISREIFSGAHVATVLPYDPIKKEILLLKQFRVGIMSEGTHDPTIIEVVAGMIDGGETPEEAARRECFEETGCKIKKIKKIYSYYPAPGSSSSYYHFFLAEVDAFDGERIVGEKHENEDIQVKSYSIEEAMQMLREGEIINGVTLISLQWFFLNYYKS